MNLHGLVDMRSDKVVVARPDAWGEMARRAARFALQAEHRVDICKLVIPREEAPVEE